ncbi:MAG TPA: copper resistance protein CopC [Acidimicrobiia bacterium]|nr:copper resistance protein CopC [Acidimicrobiia bacterium]
MRAILVTVLRRAALVACLAFVLVVVAASPAAAHAELVSSDPQSGGVYDEAPDDGALRYTEPVEASLGAVRVFDGRGERIEVGNPSHPGGDSSTVRVDLPGLRDGSYVVTWRVLSADSHPVQGAFTFQVGPEATADDIDSLAQRLLTDQGGSEAVGVGYAAARFTVFAALALLVGGAAFVVLVWPRGRESTRTRRVISAGWIGLAASTVVGLALQGPYAAGLPLGDAFGPDLLGEVLDTRSGKVWAFRLLVLLVALPLLGRMLPRRGPVAEYPLTNAWKAAAVLVAAALVVTPGLAGHAGSGELVPLAVPADAVHLGAVAVWLGGLVMLFAVLLPTADAGELRSAVPRYSQYALVSVSAIVVTGLFQSWRQVGSLTGLRDTDFGHILVIKLLLVGALVVAAAFSREIVNRTFRERTAAPRAEAYAATVAGGGSAGGSYVPEPLDDATEVRNLRRSVVIEVALAAIVLAVTALLVNAQPARSATNQPISEVFKADELWVDVIVDPARAGQNDIHVTALTTTGGPTDVLEMEVTLTQPDRDIAPVTVPLEKLGAGHYVAYNFSIPISGDWVLITNALVDDTTQVVVKGDLEIR